jgi:uncharacterized membrane protein
VIGSFVLGIIVAIVLGIITYILLEIFRKNKGTSGSTTDSEHSNPQET